MNINVEMYVHNLYTQVGITCVDIQCVALQTTSSPEDIVSKKINGQQAREKMLNITNY